jgi:hypothetical protein
MRNHRFIEKHRSGKTFVFALAVGITYFGLVVYDAVIERMHRQGWNQNFNEKKDNPPGHKPFSL